MLYQIVNGICDKEFACNSSFFSKNEHGLQLFENSILLGNKFWKIKVIKIPIKINASI